MAPTNHRSRQVAEFAREPAGPAQQRDREPKADPLTCGVSDGTRTRDIQDHNLTLYQLNYTHHRRKPAPAEGERAATSILAARMLAGRIDCSRRARLAINIGNRRRDFAGRGPWLGYERGAPVELQFADGFVN